LQQDIVHHMAALAVGQLDAFDLRFRVEEEWGRHTFHEDEGAPAT
jgi:hypothetical protein